MEAMARIGKTYPRFPQSEPQAPPAPERRRVPGYPVLGAAVGLLAGLGLIAYLLTR